MGPPESEDDFPIAVWLLNPGNASKFEKAGINLYVGLWKGPNEEQLATLTKAGMPVICAQNAFALGVQTWASWSCGPRRGAARELERTIQGRVELH